MVGKVGIVGMSASHVLGLESSQFKESPRQEAYTSLAKALDGQVAVASDSLFGRYRSPVNCRRLVLGCEYWASPEMVFDYTEAFR